MGRATVLLLVVGLLGCGGRSALVGPGGQVPQPQDGRVPGDGARDGFRRSDGGPRRDVRPWPLDLYSVDSCLAIPSGMVQGTYSGSWSGTWHCPGQGAQQVSGDLKFTLYPAGSPEAFTVVGKMSGYVVSSGFPFDTDINGTMGCTALSAQLPQILVGMGALKIELVGSIVGTFQTYPQGFPSGTWKAQEKNGSCWASGSWNAKK
jgi:hypothetical protein